jgi:hypothetical protein
VIELYSHCPLPLVKSSSIIHLPRKKNLEVGLIDLHLKFLTILELLFGIFRTFSDLHSLSYFTLFTHCSPGSILKVFGYVY